MKEKKRTLEEGLSICRDIDSRQDLEPVGLVRTLNHRHFLIEVRQHNPIECTPEESDSTDNEPPTSPHRGPDIQSSSPSTPSRTGRRLEKAKVAQPRPPEGPIPQTSPTSDTFMSAPEPSPTESYSLPGSWATPEPYVSRAPPAPAAASSQPPTYGASTDQAPQHQKSVSMPQVPPVPPVPRVDSQLRPTPTSPDGLYSQLDPRYGTTVVRNGSEAERREKRHFFGGRRAG